MSGYIKEPADPTGNGPREVWMRNLKRWARQFWMRSITGGRVVPDPYGGYHLIIDPPSAGARSVPLHPFQVYQPRDAMTFRIHGGAILVREYFPADTSQWRGDPAAKSRMVFVQQTDGVFDDATGFGSDANDLVLDDWGGPNSACLIYLTVFQTRDDPGVITTAIAIEYTAGADWNYPLQEAGGLANLGFESIQGARNFGTLTPDKELINIPLAVVLAREVSGDDLISSTILQLQRSHITSLYGCRPARAVTAGYDEDRLYFPGDMVIDYLGSSYIVGGARANIGYDPVDGGDWIQV